MGKSQVIGTIGSVPVRGGGIRDWQRWAPTAAVVWSLIYAALGINWAVSGRGFPIASEAPPGGMGPIIGRFGPGVGWVVVILAGIPAAGMGVAMARGVRGRILRPLFLAAGGLLAGVLLLLMTGLDLLVMFGYIPYGVKALITGAGFGRVYLGMLTQGTLLHQLLCLIGGFLWLAATVCYSRLSGEACPYCGRGGGPEGWTSPERAARWGRMAVAAAMGVPVFYALTRYAWALGIPLGMTQAYLQSGQERGIWISGLFLATFGLVGGFLMLGLVQRWGEVFPRWMIGLAGRRVPIPLAVAPAAFISVLLVVGGVVIWSGLGGMVAALGSIGLEGSGLTAGIIFQIGPTLLFPLWGAALAVAALGYYFRRRGPCRVCGRGAASPPAQPEA